MSTAIVLPGVIYHGIDTVHALTAEQCAALVAEGVSWVARYLPLQGDVPPEPDRHGGDHLGCWTLSLSESRTILDSGLLILPIQWGPTGGDRLDAPLGQLRGAAMVSAARQLGIPPAVHLWADYEGRRADVAGPVAGRAYLDAWAAPVVSAGYGAGLYVSIPQPLSGSQLYGLRWYDSYWGAAQGGLACPLPRDYAIRQSLPTAVAGVPCDRDVLRQDLLGELPVLWAA